MSWKTLRLALTALLVFCTGGPTVIAQDDNIGPGFWLRERERVEQRQRMAPAGLERRPTHLVRRPGPALSRQYPREQNDVAPRERNASGGAGANSAPVVTQAPTAKTPTAASFSVTLLGDSLGVMLAQGLQDTLVDAPEIAIVRRARESSGLVRDDYFDWMKAARDLVAGAEKTDLAVVMIGSNDRQPLRDAEGAHDPLSPRWNELYAARVEAFAAVFRDKKIPLVWVGLPVMRAERYSADMQKLNEIFRERSVKAGAAYVDTFEAFVDDRGQFDVYGPDVNGQTVKLRTADGVHFTKSGARKLAHFVEADIRRAHDRTRPPTAYAVVEPGGAILPPLLPQIADLDINAQIRRDGLARPDLQAALPSATAPVEPATPLRPAAGAITPLLAPSLSPGGALASGPLEPSADVRRVLVEGRTMPPKAGRADDFAWPRP